MSIKQIQFTEAGRGDVALAMGLAMLVGFYLGYQARRLVEWMKRKRVG